MTADSNLSFVKALEDITKIKADVIVASGLPTERLFEIYQRASDEKKYRDKINKNLLLATLVPYVAGVGIVAASNGNGSILFGGLGVALVGMAASLTVHFRASSRGIEKYGDKKTAALEIRNAADSRLIALNESVGGQPSKPGV